LCVWSVWGSWELRKCFCCCLLPPATTKDTFPPYNNNNNNIYDIRYLVV
jgi:hypothetical protein